MTAEQVEAVRCIVRRALKKTAAELANEEIEQAVIARIIEFRRTFNGKSEFNTWAYAIAKNMAIDWLRKLEKSIELNSLRPVNEELPTPEEELLRAEQQQAVARAIRQLDESDRVLLLFGNLEISYRAIVGLLGMKPGTMMKELSRIRQRVREFANEAS